MGYPDYGVDRSVLRPVLMEVEYERRRQDVKWGEQNWPLGNESSRLSRWLERRVKRRVDLSLKNKTATWLGIIHEEFAEFRAQDDDEAARTELIQLAAVAVAAAEALDRKRASETVPSS